MIKFSDAIKANYRFWYIVVFTILTCFAVLYSVALSMDTYSATVTMSVSRNDKTYVEGDTIPAAEVKKQIKEIGVKIKHPDFSNKIQREIYLVDKDFAEKIDPLKLSENIKFNYKEDTTFFEIKVEYPDKVKLELLINTIIKQTKEEYKIRYPEDTSKTVLNEIYSTQILPKPSNKTTFSIIGIIVGIIVAEIIIICITVYNPYVENKGLLERETGLKIIANLSKVRRDKNES